jgi:hypothetical protein
LFAIWGRVLRRQAAELLRKQVMERPRNHRYGDGINTRQITADVTPIEQDILRWLAMNESDARLTGRDVIHRNLGHPATNLEDAVLTLVGRRFITLIGGCLVFSERGRLYCIDAGWMKSAS